MKLSEAIRAGAKIRPQGFGTFYSSARRWFGLVADKRSCALGAAFEAQGCASHVEKVSAAFVGREGKLIEAGEVVDFIQPHHEWEAIFYAQSQCPQCEKSGRVHKIIPHMNDDHRWKREEIALWVERQETNQEFKLHDGDGTHERPFRQLYSHGRLDDVSTSLLHARLQVAAYLKNLVPYQGTCGRCDVPWAFVTSHCTNYSQSGGCFPLCEDCWQELRTPGNRMPYYMELIDSWGEDGQGKRQAVADAVRNEAADKVEERWPELVT